MFARSFVTSYLELDPPIRGSKFMISVDAFNPIREKQMGFYIKRSHICISFTGLSSIVWERVGIVDCIRVLGGD